MPCPSDSPSPDPNRALGYSLRLGAGLSLGLLSRRPLWTAIATAQTVVEPLWLGRRLRGFADAAVSQAGSDFNAADSAFLDSLDKAAASCGTSPSPSV